MQQSLCKYIITCYTCDGTSNFSNLADLSKIEANEKATAVWLQNTGKTDAMVQIRVFKWNQDGLKDNYSEQSEIIPSPPVAKIKAGEKHMLRLTKSANLPDGKEQSYRLIVDELPIRLSDGNEQDASKVSFQMRYSIPLFAYGKGIGSGLTEESQNLMQKCFSKTSFTVVSS